MKKLMLGNEAIARGLYEAGVTLVSSYPDAPGWTNLHGVAVSSTFTPALVRATV